MDFLEYLAQQEGDAKEFLEAAYKLMLGAHEGQMREGGQPYSTHPQAIVEVLLSTGYTDPKLLAAALLHDVVEDTDVTLADVMEGFGIEVAFLVDAVTKIDDSDDRAENLRKTRDKLLLFAVKDERVYAIKTADRVHNLQTLAAKPQEKIDRTLRETEEFFPAFAEKTNEKLRALFEKTFTEAKKLRT